MSHTEDKVPDICHIPKYSAAEEIKKHKSSIEE
jgi:hypothetical protein